MIIFAKIIKSTDNKLTVSEYPSNKSNLYKIDNNQSYSYDSLTLTPKEIERISGCKSSTESCLLLLSVEKDLVNDPKPTGDEN